jgi:hypothetical protein
MEGGWCRWSIKFTGSMTPTDAAVECRAIAFSGRRACTEGLSDGVYSKAGNIKEEPDIEFQRGTNFTDSQSQNGISYPESQRLVCQEGPIGNSMHKWSRFAEN